MKGISPQWLADIVTWARSEPRIAAVFLFGSRAKGTHGPYSDIDLAVVLTNDTDDTASGFAAFEGERLGNVLQSLLPVTLDLHFAFEDDVRVWPAVQDYGVLLYAS